MSTLSKRLLVQIFWASALALSLSGCSQLPVAFDYQREEAVAIGGDIVWPDPPETPRYRYFGQLTGEENFKKIGEESRNIAERFFRWIIGLGGFDEDPVILQRPQSGAVGEDGRIYVSDVSRQAIYVFDTQNVQLNVWELASDVDRFQLPIGVAIKGDSVLVADAALGYVAELNASGQPVNVIGHGDLKHPTGIAWDDASNRLYVADRAANQIKVFDESGQLLLSFGEFGEREGQLNGPTYMDWHDGQLYVTDTLNSRIQVFSADGEFIRTFGRRGLFVGDLPRPKGVTVDSDGNVYVVESYYDYLLVFDNKGQFLLPIGGSGHEIGQFYLPAGIWADANDKIYVADMFNGRVVIFEYLGDRNESDVAEDNSARTGHVVNSH